MKQLIAIALLASAVSIQADVIVLKLAGSVRQVGESKDQRIAKTGYVVIDVDTGEWQDVTAQSVGGKTYTTSSTAVSWHNVVGPNGRTGTSFYYQATNTPTFCMGFGYDSTLKLSSTRVVTFPKSITCKPQAVLFSSVAGVTLQDASFNLTFDAKRTFNANDNHESIGMVILEIEGDFFGKGYDPK